MAVRKSLFLNLILQFSRKFKKAIEKDDYFVFWGSLLFYFLLYFSINNKTLLGLFLVFSIIFFRRLKDAPLTLLIIYLLFLPFTKGKAFPFVLIPSWQIPFGISYTFDFVMTFADLAFVGLFALILREEVVKRWGNSRLPLKRADVFLFGFLIFVFISNFFSQFELVSFLAFLKLARIVAVYFLIQKYLLKAKARRLFPLVLAAALIFQGSWASMQFLLKRPLGRAIEHVTGRFSIYGQAAVEELTFFRPQGTFDHPNTLGSFSVVFFAFILVQIFDSKQSETKRKIFLVSLLAGLMGLVLSASRASWIVAALVSSLAVVLLKHYKRLATTSLVRRWLSILAIVFIVLLPLLILPRLAHLYLTFAGQGGFNYRTTLSRYAWSLSRNSPLGIGLINFPVEIVRKFGFSSWPAPVHNLFLEILVETGIFSLIFFLLFLIFAYKRFFLKIRASQASTNFSLRTGAFLASLAFLGVANFYPFLWSSSIFEYLWLFLGLMLY